MKKIYCSLLLLTILSTTTKAQQIYPYKNPKLPVNVRVKDLLSRMTPAEKFWQLFMIPGDLGTNESNYKNGIFGFQVSAASGGSDVTSQILSYKSEENALLLAKKINTIQKYFIERSRLGIPMMAFDECLHGLVRKGATSFPQSIGLAASFDTALMKQVSTAIALETKVRGIRDVLSPVINIANDVRWGRTEETYGEDPFLASEMAVAFVSSFEQNGVITTPKHFIANVGDGGRDSYPIHYNERFLDEIFFPPFKAAIKRGGSRSIMTAYNSYDGSASSANDWLLNKKLKKEWGFDGFVISDASAVGGTTVLHNTAKDYPSSGATAITNGLDVIFQTEFKHHELFDPPFLNGGIKQARIDDAVSRVLKAKFDLGLFEHPYVDEEIAKQWVNNTTHKKIAKKAALESIVLLKNDDNALPINKNIKSIAVIGKEAIEASLGGYSGPSNGKISILEGIKAKLGTSVQINYSEGADKTNTQWINIPSEYLETTNGSNEIQNGLKGEYYTSIDPSEKPIMTRIDKQINFQATLFPPDPKMTTDNYSIKWTGLLKAPDNGKYKIGLEGNDGFRLYLNNELVIDNWLKQSYSTKLIDYNFEKDKKYNIKVEFHEGASNGQIKLIWNAGIKNQYEQKIKDAVELAKKSDAVVIAVGIQEGEFQDRAMLTLPGYQEKLIQEVAATGKKVTVLLVGGSAITMNAWKDKVAGIIDVWYPGEEGGPAVSDVLFGDYNPAGKLPITFPLSEAQLPLVYNHKPTGRGDDYNNLSGQPLFPFGFGLSYTTFKYDHIHLEKSKIKSKETTSVEFTLTNTGSVDGEEVVQLYIKELLSSIARPVLELKGFQRVALKAGETKKLSFKITPELLQMLNEKMQTVVEPGTFRIMIGSSSRDLWLKENLEVVE
ncbi:MAG: glycoside hydrolase family 3 C-terminal domain-containing protein [Chitinophagia bacterium]|jgi:beta-glucosidase